jgi:hypothetical protein
MSDYKFQDDDSNEVKAVTAEQHALNNPGHVILVESTKDIEGEGDDGLDVTWRMLSLRCAGAPVGDRNSEGYGECDWWDEQAIPSRNHQT